MNFIYSIIFILVVNMAILVGNMVILVVNMLYNWYENFIDWYGYTTNLMTKIWHYQFRYIIYNIFKYILVF